MKEIRKSTFREIKSSFGRFMAIFAIIALGVGLFSGLKVSRDAMVDAMKEYLDEQSFYDFRLLSTLGFEEEDVEFLRSQEDSASAEGAVSVDFLYQTEDGGQGVLKAMSLTDRVNTVRLMSGRLPEAADECVVDSAWLGDKALGSVIRLAEENEEETAEMFAHDSWRVVGTVQSPLYIQFERGNTSLGTGRLSGFLYLLPEGFDTEYYTEIYVRFDQENALYGPDYTDFIDGKEAVWEKLAEMAADGRFQRILSEAEAELADARAEFEDQKAEGEEELADALQKLADGRQELADAEQKLADAGQELEDGRKTLQKKERELADAKRTLREKEQELADGEAELARGEEQWQDGRKQTDEGRESLNSQRSLLQQQRAELEAGLAQLETRSAQLEDQSAEVERRWTELEAGAAELEAGSEELKRQSAELERQLAELEIQSAEIEQLAAAGYLQGAELEEARQRLAAGRLQLEEAQRQLSAGSAQLEEKRQELEAGRKQLEEAGQQLTAGRQEIQSYRQQISAGLNTVASYESQAAAAEGQLNSADEELRRSREELDQAAREIEEGRQALADAGKEIADGEKALADAKKELEDAEKTLAESGQELEDARRELADGERDYQEGLEEFEREIGDAEEKLADAEEKLAELEAPDTYVLGRDTNIGYLCFENDSSIVEGIANIFPVFFFLVAALVCITTMNRMVEEQRTQIGVLKALGYGNGAIMGKYMTYSGLGAMLGCVAGFFLGTWGFPQILWYVYQIMYKAGNIRYLFDWRLAAVSLLVSLLCSMGTTWLSCRVELNHNAAVLMRPKAPRAGKRVFLERITFLWKRLSFLRKVSLRNIFRYKKRLFMMILGISGCTALLVTGFGINDSIADVASQQFEKVQTYDISVTFREAVDADMEEKLAEMSGFGLETWLPVMEKNMDIVTEKGTKSIYLVSSKGEAIAPYLDMHSGTGEPIDYPGRGQGVVTGKLAKQYGLKIGDAVTLRDEEMRSLTVTVSGIMENYLYNYVYISDETWAEAMGTKPEQKTAYGNLAEGGDAHLLAAELMGTDGIVSVSVNADMTERIGSMMESLNLIVAVVIICAAGLAFIVLYNLTNINITERVREIATIKVLGFYKKETCSYVFRENILLTLMGILPGLLLGRLLHAFVISQIQVDMIAFDIYVRPVSYLYSALLTLVFAWFVDKTMEGKLGNISMTESLKSVD